MATAGEQRQARLHLLAIGRLGQNAPSGGDHGIGGEDDRAGMARGDGGGLGGGDARGIGRRGFTLQRRLVDFGRIDRVDRDADPREQIQPARRGGGEDQAQRCARLI